MITFNEWLQLKETKKGLSGKHERPNKNDGNQGDSGWLGGNPRFGKGGGMGSTNRTGNTRVQQKAAQIKSGQVEH